MDGIVIINKPKNYTSHDIVKIVRKIVNEKVGHTGTLDPNATGVLPLLIGKGTQLSKYLINHDKIYEAVLKLGEKTDTADSDGKIVERKEVDNSILKPEKIKNVFNSLIGKQKQVPPMYSAIKVNGKKLYEYARKGENLEIAPREIEIYDLELLNIEKQEITYRVHCSKGTYIRTLCENIAEDLGTIGYMKELKRIKVGEFKIEDSVELEDFENNFQKSFITIEDYFKNKEIINFDDKKLQLFLNGVQLTYKLNDGIYRIYSKNTFIGTGIVKNNLLKRDIILI